MRWLTGTEWLVVGASLLVWAFIIRAGHIFVPDDVYFYLRIADSIVHGEGSTFNGVTRTNGYHPLWMICCVLLRVFVSDRERLVQALFTLCAVLHVVSLMLLGRLLKEMRVRHGWPALLAMAFFLTSAPVGSELHVSLPLLILLLRSAVAAWEAPAPSRRLVAVGALAGLALLARLDNVFFVVSVVAAVAWVQRRAWPRAFVLLGLPAVLIVLPYLAWNELTFGALVPISGLAKMGFAHPGIAKLGSRALVIIVTALTLPFAAAARRERNESWLLPGAMAAGAAAHAAYIAIRLSATWQWYFGTELICACVAIALWSDHAVAIAARVMSAQEAAAGRWRGLSAQVAPALVIVASFGVVAGERWNQKSRAEAHSGDWYIAAARAIDEAVPSAHAIATVCSPGGIGYYSHRGVFAFDELTLDYSYDRDATRNGLWEYLSRHHVTHLFGYAPDSAAARMYGAQSESGDPVECTAYRMSPDKKTLASYDVYSCVSQSFLGRIDLSRQTLERRDFCPNDVAIWSLSL
jgi:hypothetical protein